MTGDNDNRQEKSWLDKISHAFSSKPNSMDELGEVIKEAHDNKLIDADALEIIEGALNVSDQQAREIMIPRSQMISVPVNATLQDTLKIVIESQHSRFPVVGETSDDIRGILLAKDLLPLLISGSETFSIDSLIRPATIIPESKRLNVLLREFRENRYHMAVVVDEYGGVAGLVTIEDILEEIVGDIEDETDEEDEQQIRPTDDGCHLVDALTPIEVFNEHFDVGLNDDEFDTIGGLIVGAFSRLPAIGESIDIEPFTFVVRDGDNRQLKLLEVSHTHKED
ncbi:MAG: HlyC/CorC family transporter [bacterium]